MRLKYSETDQAVIDRVMVSLEEVSETMMRYAVHHSEGDPVRVDQLYREWMEPYFQYAVKITSMFMPVVEIQLSNQQERNHV